ncbi:hypothetical protein [Acinetobacter bereziniae]|uniref:hypothetical protein n=1 Tax=Acinetobacter bereziniae TaxID=106648 RepID=UPI000EF667F6|nr:hypothetical protein [Acinetobacter bereziniae]
MKKLLATLFLVVSVSAYSAVDIPDGFHVPTELEKNQGEWKDLNMPSPYKISGDFNNDGLVDEAWILPKDNSGIGFSVFAFLKTKQSKNDVAHHAYKLEEINDFAPQSFVLDIAEASDEVWETACGKGYKPCEIGETAEFKIRNPSIMFCRIESSCSVFLWDDNQRSFKKLALSN